MQVSHHPASGPLFPASADPLDAANTSYLATKWRFSRTRAALKYPSCFGPTFRDQREKACLLKALRYVPRGETVLDLPCGTGRVTRVIAEAGFRAVAADVSAAMIEQAEGEWRNYSCNLPPELRGVPFEVQDVMGTSYTDGEFGAVLCNRLFHHFNTPEVRVRALSELRRIVRHTLIVSFFNSFAVDALRFRCKHWLRGTSPIDRIPISLDEFTRNLQAAGFRRKATLPVMRGISPQWYVVAEPAG